VCGECGRRGGWIGIGGNKVASENERGKREMKNQIMGESESKEREEE
jgi:hypothetical protein